MSIQQQILSRKHEEAKTPKERRYLRNQMARHEAQVADFNRPITREEIDAHYAASGFEQFFEQFMKENQ